MTESISITPDRTTIIDRLRAQVTQHLAMHVVPEDIDQAIDHGLEIAGYQQAHFEAQWAALGLDRVRLETVPSDPWHQGQDRKPHDFRPFRNASQSVVASSAANAWRLITEVPETPQGLYLIPQVLRAEKLDAPTWGSKKTNGSVGDRDVERVSTLYVDVDCRKAAPGMATEAEVWEAFEVAATLYADLAQQLGGERGLAFLFSGSGFQVWLFHEPADPTEMIVPRTKIMHSLAALYAEGYPGRIDPAVKDLRRIGPAAGTWKRKAKSEGRPHRFTGFWMGEHGRISKEQLLALVAHFEALAPVPEAVIRRPAQRVDRNDRDGYCARANAEPIDEIWALLGGGPLVCPGCGGSDASEVKFRPHNTVHCFRAKCVAKPSHSVIDLVCAQLNLPFTAHGRAYDWLAERRGLPARESHQEFEVSEEPGMALDDDAPQAPKPPRRTRKSKSDHGAAAMIDAPGSLEPENHCPPGQFKLTDLGNAERLVHLYGQDIRYCAPWGKWLVWDGRRWRKDDEKRVDHLAQLTVRSIYSEANAETDSDRRQAIAGHAIKSESIGRKGALLDHATSLPGVVIEPSALDADPWAFNLANGTLDLRTGALRPHRREDYHSKLSPVVFDPRAKCPTFNRFLETSLPDREVREFVLRLDGYALTGSVQDHVFPIHYGNGRNGKGAHERLMLHVSGDYGRKVPIELFMMRKGETHPTEKATLFGVRYASSSENEEGSSFAVSQIKTLTGGDVVSCRRMREDFWEFWPTHKFQLHVNHKSRIKESKDAIWDRVYLIPWTVKFDEKQQDKNLDAKLRAEASGILNVLLKACLEWQATGLRPPDSIKAVNDEYRRENDVVGRFLDECCEVDAAYEVKSKDLYGTYTTWCTENGMKPWSQTALASALKEKGFENFDGPRKAYRLWKGIIIRSAAAETALQADMDANLDTLIRAATTESEPPAPAPSANCADISNDSVECGECGGLQNEIGIDANLILHETAIPKLALQPPHTPQGQQNIAGTIVDLRPLDDGNYELDLDTGDAVTTVLISGDQYQAMLYEARPELLN